MIFTGTIQFTDFVVFNGDMLTQIESEDQIINGYLRSASELFASEIPVFALRGNHENRGMFSYEFFNYFPNLANNAYYSFRHGPAYFICLDCGEDKPDSDIRYYGLSTSDEMRKEEAGWLQEIVDKKEFKAAPIKIVIIHMQPTGMWHGNLEIERLFMPILNKAGIDLMLCGHVHKHLFIEAGSGNKFPIAINSNIWRTDVRVTSSGIKINFVDASNNVTETYSVKK
jgi:DNA repair exonuclease SbcCD nuclease subunit